MKTREQIITDMCYTWRHDYGLEKSTQSWALSTAVGDISSSGMTNDERKILWNQMAQIYDNVISPHIKLN